MSASTTLTNAVNLTPHTVFNWNLGPEGCPVVLVNPAATLHHRIALAWGMACEMQSIAEAGATLHDMHVAQGLFPILQNQLGILVDLLHALGGDTARPSTEAKQEGGAA